MNFQLINLFLKNEDIKAVTEILKALNIENLITKKVDIVAVLHDINLAIRYADYIIILINAGKLYDSGEAKKED